MSSSVGGGGREVRKVRERSGEVSGRSKVCWLSVKGERGVFTGRLREQSVEEDRLQVFEVVLVYTYRMVVSCTHIMKSNTATKNGKARVNKRLGVMFGLILVRYKDPVL